MEVLACRDRAEWEAWLADHHVLGSGVWRYTPRRPRSRWSKINVAKAEALIAAGRMRAPGMAAIEAANADGRWAAAYGA